MGDEQRCMECCERECKDKCFQKCCCDRDWDRDRDNCGRDFCDDEGGSIIGLLILLLVVYCLFCNKNGSGGLFGGLF